MSLFNQLYEKIVPLAKDDAAARALADVLTDAIDGRFETRFDEFVTKKDLQLSVSDLNKSIADLKSDFHQQMKTQTWTIVGTIIASFGLAITIVKLIR